MDSCGEVHNAIDIDQSPLPVSTRIHFPYHMDVRGALKSITLLSNGASHVMPFVRNQSSHQGLAHKPSSARD
jgi:hypothetical protein